MYTLLQKPVRQEYNSWLSLEKGVSFINFSTVIVVSCELGSSQYLTFLISQRVLKCSDCPRGLQ